MKRQYTYNNPILKQTRKKLRKNQTEVERLLWQKLRNKQVNGLRFLRQYSIGFYIIDFYCPKYKLAVELDGGQHAENNRLVYDEKRTRYLQQKDVKVIRIWNNEAITNVNGVLQKIMDETAEFHDS